MLRLLELFESQDFTPITVYVSAGPVFGRARLDEDAEALVFASASSLVGGLVIVSGELVVPLAQINAWHVGVFGVRDLAGKITKVVL